MLRAPSTPTRPWRRTAIITISLLAHLGLIALVLIGPRKSPPEPLPPPSTVSMVFEGGTGAPDSAQVQNEGGITGAPPPPPPAEAPPLPTPPTASPPPPPPSPSQALRTPPTPPAPPAPPLPVPAPPPSVAQVPPAPTPPAPAETPRETTTLQPSPAELPAPPELATALPPPPPPPPAPPAEPARPPVASAPRNPFPNTLDWTRRPPLALAPQQPSPPRRSPNSRAPLDLSLGPVLPQGRPVPRGSESSSTAQLDPNFRVRGANLGADWRALFHDWLNRHGYYPLEAARRGEDGAVTIRFVVSRDGQVSGLQLINRSGSQFLDLGAQALLRNAQLPPFPPGNAEPNATIDLTINYVLIRQ